MPGLADFLAYTEEERRKSIPKPSPLGDMTPKQEQGGDSAASGDVKPAIVNESRQAEAGAAQEAQKAVTDAFTQKYDAVAARTPGQIETAPQYDVPMEAADLRGGKEEQALQGAVGQAGANAVDDLQRQQIAGDPVGYVKPGDVGKPVEQVQSPWGWIGELEQESQRAKEEDESRRRHETRRQYLAGISDAFSSLANLYYTTKGSPNQPQTYSSPLVNQSIERERARRKREYDQISARLDAARTAKEKFETQKEAAALRAAGYANGNGKYSPEYLRLREKELEFNEKREANRSAEKKQEREDKQKYNEAMLKIRQQTANTQAFNAETSRARLEYQKGKPLSQSQIDSVARSGYGILLDEIAKNKFGVNKWEDVDITKLNVSDIEMYEELTTSNPNGQTGAINKYGRKYAPNYMSKIDAATGGGASGANSGNSGNSGNSNTSTPPWANKPAEDKNKRPW